MYQTRFLEFDERRYAMVTEYHQADMTYVLILYDLLKNLEYFQGGCRVRVFVKERSYQTQIIKKKK